MTMILVKTLSLSVIKNQLLKILSDCSYFVFTEQNKTQDQN